MPFEVVTRHPVVAATIPWRTEENGRVVHRLTIVAKATFELRPHDIAVMVDPYPLFRDVHYDDLPGCSLATASDFVPRKARPEVLFVGNAYAPYGEHVATRDVSLVVRTPLRSGKNERLVTLVEKHLRVTGERRRAAGGGVSEPQPFSRLPLRWELTVGGTSSAENPVGVGADASDPRLASVTYLDDVRRPAGLGPVARGWETRAERLRGLDAQLVVGEGAVIPALFDFGFYNAAPRDQQVDVLSGHEELVLVGLNLTLPEVRARLPGLTAKVKLEIATEKRDVPLVADTLVIVGDTLRVAVTYRGDLEVTEEIAAGLADCKLHVSLVPADVPSEIRRVDSFPSVAHAPRPTIALANAVLPRVEANFLKSTQRGSSVPAAPLVATVPASLKSTQRAMPGMEIPPTITPAQPDLAPAPTGPKLGFGKVTLQLSESSFPELPLVPARVERAWASPSPTSPVQFISPAQAMPSPRTDGAAMAPIAGPTPIAPAMLSPWQSADLAPDAPVDVAAERPIEALRRSAPGLTAFVPLSFLAPKIDEAATSVESGAQLGVLTPPPREEGPLPIVNDTTLIGLTLPFQIRPPHDARVVIVKATCDLIDGAAAKLADEQAFPCGDLHWDDDDQASLRYASDFVPYKPRADVTLVGEVRSGAERNVGFVALRVGDLRHRLAVFGARKWERFGASNAGSFDKIALRWENALGGPLSPDNPVGMGFKTGLRPPHLEHPDDILDGPSAVAFPACTAPMRAEWRPRSSKLGTYDAEWLRSSWPFFPEDFDWSHFNAAPPLLQTGYLEGDERWELSGVFEKPRSGTLPALRPRAFVLRTKEAGGELVEVMLRLDTVSFDSSAGKAGQVTLVYRGLLETRDDDASDLTLAFVTRDLPEHKPMTAAEARRKLHATLVARGLVAPDAPVVLESANQASEPEMSLADVYARLGQKLSAAEAARREAPAPSPKTSASLPAPQIPQGVNPVVPQRVTPASAPRGVTQPEMIARWKRTDAVVAPVMLTPGEVPAAPEATVLERILAEGPLAGRDLGSIDLSGADLTGHDLTRTLLVGAKLVGTNLSDTKLVGAQLVGADLSDAILLDADLTEADLTGATLDRAAFTRAKLDRAAFDGVKATGTRFADVTGEHASFVAAILLGAIFDGAKLGALELTKAEIEGVSFRDAELPNLRLYDVKGLDVVFERAKLDKARADGASLPRVSFKDASLEGSIWERAVLEGALFEGAKAKGTLFVRAMLDGAVFRKAEVTGATFRKASLRGANALKANFMRSSFEGADLEGADFRGANLYQAETWRAKTKGARWELAIVAGTKMAT